MNEVGKRVRTSGSENYICTAYSRLRKVKDHEKYRIIQIRMG
jgi:hypothetical protein